MVFVWDPAKEAENVRKHKVYFEDAAYIFDDPFRIKRHDDDSSIIEERYQTIGEARLVRHTHTAGSRLTPEQKARLREAEKYPIVFDDDCPELTDEQLAEFQPVHFATWEERNRAMEKARKARNVPEAVVPAKE